MKSYIAPIAGILVVLLLAASLVWQIFFPVGGGWTEEKSLRMRELSTCANVLGSQVGGTAAKPSMHAGANPAEIEAEYKKVTDELKTLGAEAEGKIEGPKTAASYLRWSGVAMIGIAAVAAYVSKG